MIQLHLSIDKPASTSICIMANQDQHYYRCLLIHFAKHHGICLTCQDDGELESAILEMANYAPHETHYYFWAF